MHEFLLNTKILHEAGGGSVVPATSDYIWLILLLLAILIAAFVVFKKKALAVFLSIALVFSFTFLAPIKSFGGNDVSITSSAELEEGTPVQLTITNNYKYPISINSLNIANQALPADTTWDIVFDEDDYEITEAKSTENVCVDIPANDSLTFSVYPNTTEIPKGELCTFTFNAVSNHYTSTFRNDEDEVSSVKNFDFSFNDFVTADNTKVNREIAILETIFGAIPNTYNNFFLDNTNYDVSDRLAFMRNLGFQHNYYCKLWPDQREDIQADTGVSVTRPTYDYDKNDVTSFCFNHRKINYGNHETEIINISVGATGGDFEWASNFDFGADVPNYWNATKESGGNHEDWTNFDDHKGFDVAKNRLLKAYNDYYAKYIDNSATVDKIILINGHSRGGGIANLLGKHFEKQNQNQNIKPFTYTLASPNVTSIQLNDTGSTIFNIVNKDDLVALFPGNIQGFFKYGTDIEMSIYEDTGVSGKLSDLFASKTGYGPEYNGNRPAEVKELIESSTYLIEDRESAYTLDSPSSKEYTLVGSYEEQEEAEMAKAEFELKLTKYNLNYYAKDVKIEKDDNDDYVIKFTCCAAFIMQDIANFVFINKGDTSKYKPSFAYNVELIQILLEAAGIVTGVVHGHIWSSYHLIATEYNYNK